MPETVSLLTLNCWGLKYVSKLRQERLQAIAHELARAEYDVIGLQEVWVELDWEYIQQLCLPNYPFTRFFRSGIITGPGLAVLLKLPIKSTFLYRFPINGRPSAFFRGDWLVGKSIAVTIVETGSRDLALLNSHMHAPYAPEGDASYSTHRACQAWDLAQLVKTLKLAGYAVVQIGDLNSRPDSLPYKIFTLEGGIHDSWEVLKGDTLVLKEELALMQAEDQIIKGGVTCNSRLNTWRANREPWEACRLDYALIDTATLWPILASVEFTGLLSPPLSCSFSDHFAYTVTLHIKDSKHTESPSQEVLSRLYTETIDEIQKYIKVTIPFQANWRKSHFYASIIVVVGIQVGIVFASIAQPWVSVILSVISVLIAVMGVINGLICFLGVRSEKRALEEVVLEVRDKLRSIKKID